MKYRRYKPVELKQVVLDIYKQLEKYKSENPDSKTRFSSHYFKDESKRIYGVDIIGQINSKFSTNGKQNGFSNLCKELKIDHDLHKRLSDDEILEIYGQIWKTGKEPTEKLLKEKGLSLQTVNKRFSDFKIPGYENVKSGHIKAKFLSKKKYNIPDQIHIRKLIHDNDSYGINLNNYGINTKQFGITHAPAEESDVILHFIKIHILLGFPELNKLYYKKTPDCEAMYYNELKDKNDKVFIELKYKSSSGWAHWKNKKNIYNKIQFLVCWEHDNKLVHNVYPHLKIIELKSYYEDKKGFVKKMNNFFKNGRKKDQKSN